MENQENKGKKPEQEEKDYYIDDRYYCGSCNSHSHRCRCSDGMCYECGADDWEVEPDKKSELGI